MNSFRELGDRLARRRGPAGDRDAEPGSAGQRLDGRERRRDSEAAVIVTDANDRRGAQEATQHDGDDREAVAARFRHRRRAPSRSIDDPALELRQRRQRRWWRRRRRLRLPVERRQQRFLVQTEAGDAGITADRVRDRLPVGRDDSAGQRQVRTAEGSLAREPRGSRLERERERRFSSSLSRLFAVVLEVLSRADSAEEISRLSRSSSRETISTRSDTEIGILRESFSETRLVRRDLRPFLPVPVKERFSFFFFFRISRRERKNRVAILRSRFDPNFAGKR